MLNCQKCYGINITLSPDCILSKKSRKQALSEQLFVFYWIATKFCCEQWHLLAPTIAPCCCSAHVDVWQVRSSTACTGGMPSEVNSKNALIKVLNALIQRLTSKSLTILVDLGVKICQKNIVPSQHRPVGIL